MGEVKVAVPPESCAKMDDVAEKLFMWAFFTSLQVSRSIGGSSLLCYYNYTYSFLGEGTCENVCESCMLQDLPCEVCLLPES